MSEPFCNQTFGEPISFVKRNEEIEAFKRRIAEKDEEAKEYRARAEKVAAEFEDYKKKVVRRKGEWTKYANEELIKVLLPFIDNLERAVYHGKETDDFKSLSEGIRLTIRQLLHSLEMFGVSFIKPGPIQSNGSRIDSVGGSRSA